METETLVTNIINELDPLTNQCWICKTWKTDPTELKPSLGSKGHVCIRCSSGYFDEYFNQ